MTRCRRLVVLSSIDQYNHYVNSDYKDEDLILPLHPQVRSQCTSLPNESVTVSSLASHTEFLQAKDLSKSRIKAIVSELNLVSSSLSSHFKPRLGDYAEFQLQIVLGSIFYNRFIISCLERHYPQYTLILYHQELQPIYHFRPHPYSIFSSVIQAILSSCSLNVEIRQIKPSRRTSFAYHSILPLLNDLKNFLKSCALTFSHITSSPHALLRHKHRISALVLGSSKEWPSFLQSTSLNVLPTFICKELAWPRRFNHVTHSRILQLLESAAFGTSSHTGLELIQPLARELSALCEFIHHNSGRLLQKISSIDCLLYSVHIYPLQLFFCHLASFSRKKVICWQHGSQGYFDSPFHFSTEIRFANTYFAYSSATAKYIRNLKPQSLHVVNVGSSYNNIPDNDRDILLYVTTKWHYTSSPFDDYFHPDDRLYNLQTDILDFLSSLPEQYHPVFRPSNTPLYDYTLPVKPNISVDKSSDLRDLISKSRIIIFDTIGTGLLQAISTTKPVFVVLGRNLFYPSTVELLSRRAVICPDGESLLIALNSYLSNNYYPASCHDTSFMDHYLGHPYSTSLCSQRFLSSLSR